MDTFIIIIGFIFIIIGLAGCIIPGLPGPPLSFLGLLIQQTRTENPFTWKFLGFWAIITIIVTALDYFFPIYGAKRFGGSQKGMYGSLLGLLIGIFFFPPFGIIVGPFVGAWLGELVSGKDAFRSLRAAIGSFVGFLTGTAAKLVVSGLLTYHFVRAVF